MLQALVCLLLSSSSPSLCEFWILALRYGNKSIKCHFSLIWSLDFTVRKNKPTGGQVCFIYTPVIVLISEEDYDMDQNLLLNQIQKGVYSCVVLSVILYLSWYLKSSNSEVLGKWFFWGSRWGWNKVEVLNHTVVLKPDICSYKYIYYKL